MSRRDVGAGAFGAIVCTLFIPFAVGRAWDTDAQLWLLAIGAVAAFRFYSPGGNLTLYIGAGLLAKWALDNGEYPIRLPGGQLTCASASACMGVAYGFAKAFTGTGQWLIREWARVGKVAIFPGAVLAGHWALQVAARSANPSAETHLSEAGKSLALIVISLIWWSDWRPAPSSQKPTESTARSS